MNSFRVLNARFRILKGGKIGLSLSIFLLGSMLTLSKTNALATDYFNSVQVNTTGVIPSSSGTHGTANVQQRTTSGTISETRTATDYASVVFSPQSWGTYYTSVSFVGDFDLDSNGSTETSRFTLGTVSSDALILTFSSSANAGSISKDTTSIFSVSTITTNITGGVTNNYDSTITVGSTEYTANLIFAGSNDVSGATNIGNGNITFTGGGSTFIGTVNAGSMDVNTTGTIRFNSDVDLSAGTTDELNFIQGGTVEFGSDFKGNITTNGVNNQGTVTFLGDGNGKSQALTGNVGSSTSSDISTLNIGSGASSYSTLTINGDIYSNSTVLNNNSTLILSNNSDLNSSSITTTGTNNTGTLTLNGSSTITGTVGVGNALKDVNSGVGTSTFNGTVNSQNVTNTGTGTTTFKENVIATNVNVNAGTSNFEKSLNATTTTITTGTGNFNTVSGITNSNIVFGGDGIANLNNGLTGNVTTNSAGTGTLNLVGSNNQTVNGNVGVGNALKDVNSGVGTSTFNGTVNSQNVTNTGTGTTTFKENVIATNVNVNAGTSNFEKSLNATTTTITTGTGNFNTVSGITNSNIVFGGDGIANLNNGLTGNVTTNSAGTGTLNLVGSNNQAVNGNVGVGNALKDVNSGVGTSTFNGTVNSQNVTNTGTGTTTFKENVIATNVNVNAGTSNFEKSLNATTTTITTGTGNFNTVSGITNSNIVFGGDGIANLNNGLTGNVTTNSAGTGTLNLVGSNNQAVNGNVGVGNALKDVNSGVGTSTFNGTVNSQNVTNTGTGTTTFKENVIATNVNVNAGTSNFEKSLNATTTTITTGTGNFNTVSGITNSNIVFGGDGIANLNNGLTGNVNFAGNDGTVNVTSGNLAGNVTSIGTNGNLNISGTTTVTGTVGTNTTDRISEINGSASTDATFKENVFANNVNVNDGEMTFEKSLNATTTTITTGTGNFNTVSGITNSNIVFGGDGIANLNNGLTGNVTTNSAGTGTLNLVGSNNQTVNGNVGVGNALKDVNSGVGTSTFNGTVNSQNVTNTGTGTTTFKENVIATNVNVNAGTSNFEKSLNATTTTITTGTGNFNTVSGITNSNIVFGGDGIANLNNGLTGNVTTNSAGTGTLNLVGSNNQAVNGNVGVGNALKDVNSGVGTSTFNGTVNSQNVTNTGTGTTTFKENVIATNVNVNAGTSNFEKSLNATTTTITTGTGNFNTVSGITNSNIVFGGDGIANLNNGLTGNVTTNSAGTGTLNLVGSNNQAVNGTVGVGNALKDVNSGVGTSTFNGTVNSQNVTNTGTGTTTFKENVIATNVNVNAGTSNFEKSLNATTTTITTGTGNFNTVSGITNSNIVFGGDGTANLYGNLTGDINFSGNDAIVNIADGKGILGSVETLANNNTGILNFKGDGVIDGIIGSVGLGIEELNINSENEQDKDGNGTVITQGLLAHREIFAEIINLRNNATLTLANNANVTKTSTGLVISTDNANSGNVVFLGSSTVTGEVGTNNNNLESITAGATGETVTFNDMVYATNLKYLDDGRVILNGNKTPDSQNEGMNGTVDFDSKAGKLEIGDDINLTTETSGIEFANANNATLTFNGTSNVLGNIGSENGANDTFKTINAGATGEIVKFEDNVFVMDSLNLTSLTGKVQIADGNYVKRNSTSATTGAMVTTSTDGFGDLEYLGSTTLHGDIGTSSSKLNNVTFASTGNSSNIYNQDIDKNVYALNTYIGNGSNKTTLNIKEDITFGGNLNLRKDSVLDVSDYNVTVDNNLDIASNATLNFKVNATDLEGLASSTYGNYGSINSTSLTIDNDSEIHISYVGTLNGTDTYDLIRTSNIILTNYEGTELNGLVSDDSIVNSVVKNVGNNLVLFVDRTGGGSFAAEDLYIEKSGIGKDYSNGASRSLAVYAKEQDRAGALTDIVRKMEYFEGGTDVSEAKKDEMIAIQRKLTPIANSSNIQTAVTSTNLATTTVGSRLSDIRRTETNNFTPNIYKGNYAGLSSGDYGYDTSFWVKGMGAKATQDKVKNYYGFNNTSYGFVAGMDKTMHDGAIFGIAVGYSDTKTNQDNADSDSSNTNSVQATIYSSKEFGNTYLDGYLSYSKHTTDGTRTANSGKVTSSVDSDQISAKVESGHKFRVNDGISVTPFASLEYSLLNQKGYTEKGSAYQNDALKVDGLKLNRGTVEVGAKLTSNIELEDTLIIPQFTASVYNSFGDNKADVKAQFVGGGNKFTTPVQELNQTMVNVGVGVETKISDSTSLIFDIEHDRSKDGNFESYSGNVTFGVSF